MFIIIHYFIDIPLLTTEIYNLSAYYYFVAMSFVWQCNFAKPVKPARFDECK